ncbi:uncharacterized protein LOC124937437 isoform X1 [Impatiens glandulifera]|uniref:uncharacterized protein LOC124937437 isoform X1 n=1 Tax=Impatiens glandulifera TaxID=253017 RepID=UPI001FB1783D|nr:uncharacterized protein LOC124937437 isoform X1 [Impatiens glandulifera]
MTNKHTIPHPCKRGEEEEETMEDEKIENQETSNDNSLVRTPSCHVRRESEDPENEFALSTLIRQASLTSSDVFLNNHPRNPRKKAMKKSYSAPRAGPGVNNNPERKNIEVKQTGNQVEKKQTGNLRKSMSNLETQVLALRRHEFEHGQTSSSSSETQSQVPKWPDKASSAEDMKAQIKFWARSVAANANGR